MKFVILIALLLTVATLASAGNWKVSQEGAGKFSGANHEPVLAAIAEAEKSGGGEIEIGPGVYRINKSLSLDGTKHLVLRGQGDVTLQLAPALVTELAAPAAVGTSTLILQSSERVRVGLLLRVMAPGKIAAITGEPKPSFEAEVIAIDGTTVTLKDPLLYSAPAGARVVDERDLNLFTIAGESEDITLENLTLDGGLQPDGLQQATHHTRCGVWIQGRYDYLKGPSGPKPRRITIRNCRLRNFHGRGIAIYSADDCVVENCVIENVLDEGINLDHFSERCRVTGNVVQSAKVGIELNDVNDSVVEHNEIGNCRFGIRVWRYCKLEALNLRNEILTNRLSGIASFALEFQSGTSGNLARGNVLTVPAGSRGKAEGKFRDAGSGNRMEENRIEEREE